MTQLAGGWTGCPPLPATPLDGRSVRCVPLDSAHAGGLSKAFSGAVRNWDWLPYGPLDLSGWQGWIDWAKAQPDTIFFTVCPLGTGAPSGIASFLRITPAHGVAEIGHLNLAPCLQGSRAATEALTLMMGRVFEAGYRRCEWKCNAANLASRRAAQRLGFGFEGVFRQHQVVKGANRDTAWFSVLDGEWPALSDAFARWLDDRNFGPDGAQQTALSAMTRPLLAGRDPALAG
ncbi:GNAT family N-acetyltransferase [Meridianimarinicoccus roseus]|uniref:GNAT family N-acetyltransferase n=1 Tax=Meridianimarinicoccus roseus TaxID=2072018 RepID=UPI001EE6577A|nr:GNAT family protein [Meridianimarinicoccus roseus]